MNTHLEGSNLIQHNCLELLVADVPVAQHLVDLSAQLVDVAVTAAASSSSRQNVSLCSRGWRSQNAQILRTLSAHCCDIAVHIE